jgi:hypothetical protein
MNVPPPGHHDDQTPPRVSNAKPAQQARALDKDRQGEARGPECPLVRFTLRRVRLLDVDAKWGSVKDLLDGLQYAGLIRGDREGEIRLEVQQERVGHFAEEMTEIEIEVF